MKRILYHVWRGTFCARDMAQGHPWPVFAPLHVAAIVALAAAGIALEAWAPVGCLLGLIVAGCFLGYVLSADEDEVQP